MHAFECLLLPLTQWHSFMLLGVAVHSFHRYYPILGIDHSLFIHAAVDGHHSYFEFGGLVKLL